MSTLSARLCGCLGVLVAGLLALTPASGQQTCQQIDAVTLQCPNPESISGEPPNCFCDGAPIDSLELTCARNFGCPDATFVGEGNFPECWCRKLEDTGDTGTTGSTGGGTDTGTGPIGSSLGGADTCAQFFECPQGAEMVVEVGQCFCEARYAPAVKE